MSPMRIRAKRVQQMYSMCMERVREVQGGQEDYVASRRWRHRKRFLVRSRIKDFKQKNALARQKASRDWRHQRDENEIGE